MNEFVESLCGETLVKPAPNPIQTPPLSFFLSIVQDYFSQSTDKKLKDARPEHGYQVGSTPELTEIPKCGKDDRCTDFVQNVKREKMRAWILEEAAIPPQVKPNAFCVCLPYSDDS